jgi:hypothetical protein
MVSICYHYLGVGAVLCALCAPASWFSIIGNPCALNRVDLLLIAIFLELCAIKTKKADSAPTNSQG